MIRCSSTGQRSGKRLRNERFKAAKKAEATVNERHKRRDENTAGVIITLGQQQCIGKATKDGERRLKKRNSYRKKLVLMPGRGTMYTK